MNLQVHGVGLGLERPGQLWESQNNEEREGIHNQRKRKVEKQGMIESTKERKGSTRGREMVLCVLPQVLVSLGFC